jgi:hypothetical protein
MERLRNFFRETTDRKTAGAFMVMGLTAVVAQWNEVVIKHSNIFHIAVFLFGLVLIGYSTYSFVKLRHLPANKSR